MYCNECIKLFHKSGGLDETLLSLKYLTVTDSDIYDFLCPKGHNSSTTIGSERFELLFEIGANAIIDGYYREAVSSFSSSLERFYEYFLKIVAIKTEIPEANFNEAWKHIKNQSERQAGAFIFTWLSETGENPSHLSQKSKEFRNLVIHRGKIPSETEAINFGEEVLKLLNDGICLIITEYDEYRGALMGRNIKNSKKKSNENHTLGGMSLSTIASLTNRNTYRSLEQGLVDLKKQ